MGSADGRDGSIVIHQDVELRAGILNAGERVTHTLRTGRKAWFQVVRGSVLLNGARLDEGDGAAIAAEPALTIAGQTSGAEFLVFDLP